jgi:hypothetical protein
MWFQHNIFLLLGTMEVCRRVEFAGVEKRNLALIMLVTQNMLDSATHGNRSQHCIRVTQNKGVQRDPV